MGRALRPELLGVVGYALAHSATLEHAMARVARFRALVNPALAPRITRSADEVELAHLYPHRLARASFVGEGTVLGYVTLFEQLTGARPRLLEARFQHRRPADVARYVEVFRCPLVFDDEVTSLTLPASTLSLEVKRADPQLCAYLEDHARTLLARLPQDERLSDRVKRLIAQELRGGEPAQAAVARQLGMSGRTLQRRLQQEGTSFTALLDEMRRQHALLYLQDRRMAVYEVAYLLGYREPSAFFRAFRRWTGETPQALRARAGP
jgi:AraC-like DNA-binding protein